MRIVNGVLSALMLVFALVQYNDPDFWFWGPIYGVAASLAAIAAFRPSSFRSGGLFAVTVVCAVLAIVGTVYFWPTDEGFWRQDIWWESETAREGMGMMIVTLVLLVVFWTATRIRRRGRFSGMPMD